MSDYKIIIVSFLVIVGLISYSFYNPIIGHWTATFSENAINTKAIRKIELNFNKNSEVEYLFEWYIQGAVEEVNKTGRTISYNKSSGTQKFKGTYSLSFDKHHIFVSLPVKVLNTNEFPPFKFVQVDNDDNNFIIKLSADINVDNGLLINVDKKKRVRFSQRTFGAVNNFILDYERNVNRSIAERRSSIAAPINLPEPKPVNPLKTESINSPQAPSLELYQTANSAPLEKSPKSLFEVLNDKYLTAQEISKGANVNEIDRSGLSPLMRAVIKGDFELVSLLINSGANVNFKDSWGRTALVSAINTRSIELCQLLLDSGADVNEVDVNGRTPLMEAVRISNLPLIDLFVSEGADVNMADKYNQSALSFALSSGSKKAIVELLMSKGADISNKNNLSAFMKAIKEGYEEIVELFFDSGASANAKDGIFTALQYAVQGERKNIVEMLFNHGADVNATNQDGLTALMLASSMGNLDLVSLLIEKGADKQLKDNNGHDALFFAEVNGYKQVTQVLNGL